ncbi:MAG: class I tRNA ligase family protein, partial [Ignavibacteria bacterium]|nr:class I tRNA ligase family protein [Ignavibacteria bacterium]
LAAYQTLYECLETICKLTSPFIPFLSEEIYQNLNSVTRKESHESIHISEYPKVGKMDKELELKMDVAQKVVYLTRAMRAKENLKVRQPLKKIMVAVEADMRGALALMKDVILDEVNIKELVILEDDSEIVQKSAKANFQSIGPRFGKQVKQVAAAITALSKNEISKLESGDEILLSIDDSELTITKEDIIVVSSEIKGWAVESDGTVTAAIDKELDMQLIAEGLAREFVNRVQNMRKDAGFEVTDKIKIYYSGSELIIDAVESFNQYISNETLAECLERNGNENKGFKQDWEIGEQSCSINIEKISF